MHFIQSQPAYSHQWMSLGTCQILSAWYDTYAPMNLCLEFPSDDGNPRGPPCTQHQMLPVELLLAAKWCFSELLNDKSVTNTSWQWQESSDRGDNVKCQRLTHRHQTELTMQSRNCWTKRSFVTNPIAQYHHPSRPCNRTTFWSRHRNLHSLLDCWGRNDRSEKKNTR